MNFVFASSCQIIAPFRYEKKTKNQFLKIPLGIKCLMFCAIGKMVLFFSCLPIVRRREWHGAFYFPSPEWLERTNVYTKQENCGSRKKNNPGKVSSAVTAHDVFVSVEIYWWTIRRTFL